MSRRTVNYYLIKTARLSGWVLLALMLVLIPTGFSMSGRLGFGKLIDKNLAKDFHLDLTWPLVAAFLVHVSLTTYFAMRRLGWIKRRSCR